MKCPQCGNEFLDRLEDGALLENAEHTEIKHLWRCGCPVCHWISEEWNGYRISDSQGTRFLEVPAPFWENIYDAQ